MSVIPWVVDRSSERRYRAPVARVRRTDERWCLAYVAGLRTDEAHATALATARDTATSDGQADVRRPAGGAIRRAWWNTRIS
jgi:hypothetical protein